MQSIFFLFSHPAPYKVNLFNGLAKSFHLMVYFERELGRYAQQQYLPKSQWQFPYRMLKGLNLGKENHFLLAVIAHLRKQKYDTIVMNGYASLTEMITILFLQWKKIPYYLYVNGGVIRKDHRWKYALKKRLISRAIGYFSPTPLVDSYLVHYGANPRKINHYPYATIFANEVLVKPLKIEEKLALRKTVGLPQQGNLLIAVGQFIDRKNFLHLIQAWQHVAPDRQLILIGDGPQKHAYLQSIKRMKLTHVIIKPFQPKNLLLSMLRASDGFILLSKEDIYGHVINEALSQGIPVLTSDQVVSGRVLIKQGINGLIIPASPIDQFPKIIDKLLLINNPQASLDTAKLYTIEAMIQAHIRFFNHG